tara:strand:- start:298 stop:837 length:540 start_codon:yes stop_codon:yes gene_type:complete
MATSIIKADEIRKVNDTVLMSDGALSSNVTFPAGHVLRVAQNNFNTQPTRGSTSFGAFSTAITATINNCTTGNKILIILSIYCQNNISQYFNFRLVDTTNSNAVIGTEGTDGLMGRVQDGGNEIYCFSNSILYTPASFSSGTLTVELYGKADGGTLYINKTSSNASRSASSITLMEVQS